MTFETVLIVEDEPDLAEIYGGWLSQRYDVTIETDGESALDRIDGSIDIVLLDRRMPGLSGDAVLSEIRDRDVDCYVIVVSAIDPGWDILEMGFDAYLTKPIHQDQLLNKIRKLESRSSFHESIQRIRTLQEKVALLRERKSNDELENNSNYRELCRELEQLTEEVDRESERLLDDNEFVALIRDCERQNESNQ